MDATAKGPLALRWNEVVEMPGEYQELDRWAGGGQSQTLLATGQLDEK